LPPFFPAIGATPEFSESRWREVAASTNWAFNANGTISFQASHVNGSKLPYAKFLRSSQVSMPNEQALSQGMIEFECWENQLAVFLTEVYHPSTRSLVECAGTNAGRFANCRRHHQIVPKIGRGYLLVRRFPVEKANNHSPLELHEKCLNSKCTWVSLENAIILIDWHGGQIRSSGTEANPRQ
jgi:hypothetical protein